MASVAPYMPEGRRGIHFMQQWFNLSNPAMEDALHDAPPFRDFAGLCGLDDRLPDETTILRFCHVLEQHQLAPQILKTVDDLLQHKGLKLKTGTVVDATLVAAPSSTKNATGERDPETMPSKKGNQWYFGMKTHIGTATDSEPVHTVRGTSGNVNYVAEANSLLHGEETEAWSHAGSQGAGKRPDAKPGVRWNIAMRPGKRKQLDPEDRPIEQLTDELERIKARIRAKVEHPSRVIKPQFGHLNVRYNGLAKNTAQLHTFFTLANLWMAGKHFQGAQAEVRPTCLKAAGKPPLGALTPGRCHEAAAG